jgi:hypothetical protein
MKPLSPEERALFAEFISRDACEKAAIEDQKNNNAAVARSTHSV